MSNLEEYLIVVDNPEYIKEFLEMERAINYAESLLSKALGHLNTCSESDSNDLYKEIAAAFGIGLPLGS